MKLIRRPSPKPQAPSSREAPNFKFQIELPKNVKLSLATRLELGAWNFSGAWSLGLGAFL
jgi:hypothetical protein